MPCCPECFGDPGLRRIIPGLSAGNGNCPYCLSNDVPLVEPERLGDAFSVLVGIYEPNFGGEPLVSLLKADWHLFDHPRMDEFRCKDLLAAILGNGEIVRQSFVPFARFETDRLVRWEQLRDELMRVNRYFPDSQIDTVRLGQLLKLLTATEPPTQWFRARIQDGDDPFPIDKMGAPPAGVASHGRANPPGIPYLYLGSTAETAVSEIRPHTGETASVAEFGIPDGLRLVDLRDPKGFISPFDFGDEDEIGVMRSDLAFLDRLGEELTRPVLPQRAAVDYVPSQYLCEFIKKEGFDGVLYRSSVSEGMNLALFDPARAIPRAVTQMRVRSVRVDVE